MTREEIFELARKCGAPGYRAGTNEGEKKMRAPITSAQAMSHPTVVETINTLGAIADKKREYTELLRSLLYEVAANYTRDDDLPDDLLPRIDAALALPDNAISTAKPAE